MIDGMTDKEKDVMIAHNLPSFDIRYMTAAFLANDSYRRSPARVRWYHEVLSFSPLDREHIDNNVLERIARQYIDMRNPRAMCFAVSHRDTDHQHLHFCFSGTEYRHKKTLRMDDEVFKNLREGIEYYQQQEFPELVNSIVYLGKERIKNRARTRDKNARSEREYQVKRRRGKQQSEKEKLRGVLKNAFNQSRNRNQFYATLRESEIDLYEREGRIVGIMNKRKYRFSTLGITSDMLQSLERLEKRDRKSVV